MVRGEIVCLPTPRRARGHEQRGARPGVIVQADELLGLSTLLVVPTSRSAMAATFRPTIRIKDSPTRVLTDQLRVFDTQTLGESIGRLNAAELEAVDEGLAVVLGLRFKA